MGKSPGRHFLAKEQSIVRMLRNGAAGYILKDINPAGFELALGEVLREGFYLPGDVATVVINAIAGRANNKDADYIGQPLKDRELEFLHFCL